MTAIQCQLQKMIIWEDAGSLQDLPKDMWLTESIRFSKPCHNMLQSTKQHHTHSMFAFPALVTANNKYSKLALDTTTHQTLALGWKVDKLSRLSEKGYCQVPDTSRTSC